MAGALFDDLDAVGRGVQVANPLEEPSEAGVQGVVHGALKGVPVGVGELVARTAVVGRGREFPGQIIGRQEREVVGDVLLGPSGLRQKKPVFKPRFFFGL